MGEAIFPYIRFVHYEAMHEYVDHYRQRVNHAPQRSSEAFGRASRGENTIDKLPNGRGEVKAVRPTGKISDGFNFLKKENGSSLSIEDINEVAARGWAGER